MMSLVSFRRSRATSARSGDIIREQAESYGARCLDAWAMPDVADPDLYGTDRVHLNSRGHQLMAAACADMLAPRSLAVG